jgi:hypothetical protein
MWTGFACPLREQRPRRPAGRVVDGLARIGAAWPRSPQAPRRVPPWGEAPAGRGHDVLRPGATGPLILIPPEDMGPVLGHSRACRMAGPGIREVPGGGLHGGEAGRAGRPRAAGSPDGRSGGSCGSRTRPSGAGLRTWTTASGGRRQALAGGVSRPAPRLDLCRPGEDSATVGRSLVSAGCGATSGIGSGPALRDSRDGRLSVGSCDD